MLTRLAILRFSSLAAQIVDGGQDQIWRVCRYCYDPVLAASPQYDTNEGSCGSPMVECLGIAHSIVAVAGSPVRDHGGPVPSTLLWVNDVAFIGTWLEVHRGAKENEKTTSRAGGGASTKQVHKRTRCAALVSSRYPSRFSILNLAF
jgi:hypothetical protein